MKKKATLKDVVMTALAVFCALALYFTLGRRIKGLFADDFAGYFAGQLFQAVLAMAAVILLKKKGIFRADLRLLRKGWLSAGLMFVICLLSFFLGASRLLEASATARQVLFFLGQMALVGFSEEVLFRGLIQRTLHEYFGEQTLGQVLKAVILAGAVFGSVHLMNGFVSGVGFKAAGIQALVTAFIGMYFGAIYFRTGKNIWYLMFLHALYDTLGMIAGGRLNGATEAAVLAAPDAANMTAFLTLSGFYFLITLFVLRPKKTDILLEKPDQGQYIW